MSTARDDQCCILFYKYHPLTADPDALESYRRATEALCTSLKLTGRILIGLSDDGEGINGTLAGTRADLDAYVDCMLGRDVSACIPDRKRADAAIAYRGASGDFFERLNLPELFLSSPGDFKWSSRSDSDGDESWFPDLNIKIVKEIISTGGAFSNILTKDTGVGYLTPREWHKEMQSLLEKKRTAKGENCNKGINGDDEEVETILIDVRNHKECQIGSFAPGISIDPQTKTFAQFSKWCLDNYAESAGESETKTETPTSIPGSSSPMLNNKRILMYCTGGIRCEKASAFIRQVVPENKGVYHLKGGIHKYLEEYGQGSSVHAKEEGSEGGECLFVGKNFVFDRRGALDSKGHGIDTTPHTSTEEIKHDNIIGKCQYCSDPYDTFHPSTVCTVCREPVLVCETCQFALCQKQSCLRGFTPSVKAADDIQCDGETKGMGTEYHCEDHFHLNACYFTNLHGFSSDNLTQQLADLRVNSKNLESIGKKGKQRRRTLRKQIDKIELFMKDRSANEDADAELVVQCRHCGSCTCASDCWGFHGGNTRMVNKKKSCPVVEDCNDDEISTKFRKQRTRVPSNQRPGKRMKRQNDLSEIEALQLSNPPSKHRQEETGLRVPPPVVRTLRSGVKGRWAGKTVRWVMNKEFGGILHGITQKEKDDRLEQLIAGGLIRINGVPISSTLGSNSVLRNGDTLERIVHWHEPPIYVPPKIALTKHALPETVLPSDAEANICPLVYCIDKPASIPVYAAGPYYANSLLMMVEAQEELPPKSLIPLHRIDRATSGVVICANMPSVARVIQGKMTDHVQEDGETPVKKLYLARVKGRFPHHPSGSPTIPKEYASIATISWCGDGNDVIEVEAPIAVQLEQKGGETEVGHPSNQMMHRTVRSDGKHSISRFKYLSYDSTTDQSVLCCCPITGRGHQLRVHLQLIGYPIHNDVEYGGTVDEERRIKRETLSAQSMLDVTWAGTECRHEEAITAEEIRSAVELCACCNGSIDDIKATFNSAQLLGCGHAIDLHAHKYCIHFGPKKSDGDGGKPLHERGNREPISLELTTSIPPWAAGMVPESVPWLN